MTEVISAMESGGITIELGQTSFSLHLNEALSLAAQRGPTKIIHLHAELTERLRSRPVSRQAKQPSWHSMPDDYGLVRQKCSHYWLAGASRTIVLVPLSKPAEVTSPALPVSLPQNTVPSCGVLQADIPEPTPILPASGPHPSLSTTESSPSKPTNPQGTAISSPFPALLPPLLEPIKPEYEYSPLQSTAGRSSVEINPQIRLLHLLPGQESEPL
ncbi:hypothetical protein B0T26DRAFT_218878 [Lasiosphaeria miniovina]|uniref:Uncharacterized protein n=1 Tax=Lasiosphaeria miniovina TaxID=1954250 RepID=A0AA40E4Q1_9PEZI|nr:uncharacterized protein B0T26DRAFT_218878 [Lasiosphaeria miniovina]KAK0722433.1 hypothetical protein B0T26DRAFT_218878 [Lasiosphaeria miniovina]